MREAQASGRQLALYHVFKDDAPFFADYTPTFSPGGLLLALHSAIRHLPIGHEVLIFFQDASFPSSFTSSSPYLGPLTHALDAYLGDTLAHCITGFWAARAWTWAGKHAW
jgi:hypothetical protein